jgi:hypothetical protein
MEAERISMLVTVKAYPNISATYGEVVCVAGIRTDTPEPQWIRLYPVEYRDIAFSQRFKKYDVIELEVRRNTSDPRPESYKPNIDSLTIIENLDTKRGWSKRTPHVAPLIVDSMCAVARRRANDGTSLAAFRPALVEDFTIEPEDRKWAPQKAAIANQPSLLFPGKRGLEKIPYRFRYRYRCSDARCRGHHQTIIDWELAQSYRGWTQYPEELRLEKLRDRWLDEMCGEDKDTVFFVGNQYSAPEGFLVLGVFWPPKPQA